MMSADVLPRQLLRVDKDQMADTGLSDRVTIGQKKHA